MGKFATLFESQMPQKRKFSVTVTRKGEDKPHTYDAESYGSKTHYAKHAQEGDTVHKIVDVKTGEDVTARAKKAHEQNLGDHDPFHESTEVTEALKKIGQHEAGNRKATVHRDAEWGEYRVKFHTDGKHHGEDSDYHTDDKQDAHDTAKSWVSKHEQKNESKEPLAEDRGDRKEFDANNHLADSIHHVYVTTRGKKKSIAGPFRSKEEAEAHPARKFGDGVTTSDQIHH